MIMLLAYTYMMKKCVFIINRSIYMSSKAANCDTYIKFSLLIC